MNDNKIKVLIERLRDESLYIDNCSLPVMDLCMESADMIEILYKIIPKNCSDCIKRALCDMEKIEKNYSCDCKEYEIDFEFFNLKG